MADLLQSEGWERFQRALGRKTERVGGVLGITMPLPFGMSYVYAPRGSGALMGNGEELPSVVFLRSEFGSELPTLNAQLLTPLVLRHALEPEWTWRTSLAVGDPERLATMHEKHRYNIGLARRRGVVVRGMQNAEVGMQNSDTTACWELLQNTAERKAISTHARTYYETMLRELPRTMLWIAEHRGVPVACAIVAYHGDTATYLHGGSSHAHRALMAPHLLHWEAMRMAQEAGLQWYDFGGVEPPAADGRKPIASSRWVGITRFKQGFGGEEVRHPPMRDLIFQPMRYRMLSWLARLRG